MANTITTFLETLVAAAGDYNAAPVGRLSYLDAVYKDVKPEAARAGKTVQVYFPDLGAFADIGNGAFSDENLNPTSTNLVFNQHPGKSFTVTDFEQWQTAVEIREKFIDPLYKRAAEYLNGQIAALITGTNFNVNTAITSSLAAEVTPTDAAFAWDNLAAQKCPVDDVSNMRIAVHNNVYRRMLVDNAWVQENQVGAAQAEAARQAANMRRAYNSDIVWDQQAPKTSSALAGTVTATNASATVTGSGTNFTNALIGTNLSFSGDPNATQYRVTAVASTTSLTISPAFAGTTAAGQTATSYSYQALMFHKYSIALALRPMPAPDTNVVAYQPITIKDIPLRVMIGYQQRTPGYLVTCDFGYALGVIRPSWGQLINC